MKRVAPPKKRQVRSRWFFATLGIGGLLVLVFVTNALFVAFKTKTIVYENLSSQETEQPQTKPSPFPIGVDPIHKIITENQTVDRFMEDNLSFQTEPGRSRTNWFGRIVGKLALFNWYQNLASLTTRILVIQSGERKEEVANNFTKILGWTSEEKQEFLDSIVNATPLLSEGKFFPGTYVVAKDALPADVTPLITQRFNDEILSRYGPDIEKLVPLKDTLTLASLLEREAYDFDDMRQISGVIWNRLFIDMNLQIDATLQYAKGSNPKQPWWPRVIPSDKYLDSPFNTYQNEGLPPAPIANPSLDSILAALNPRNTDCMYYFHDKNGDFHCTKTYKEHVALIKQYYGK